MARPPRDQSEGVRHIWCRGNRKKPVFADARDRERYLTLLAKAVEKCGWTVYAYCLMTNHIHLVVRVPDGTMAKGMQILHGEYAQAYNRRHEKDGHTWRGRYSANRVDEDSYLLNVLRYVVNNPVRAGMVGNAAQWQWSSHRAMLGKALAPAFLDKAWTLRQFSTRNLRIARRLYKDFVDAANAENEFPAPDEPRGQTPGHVLTGRVPAD
jgi:REP element-mobilizing transposase RayT